MFLLTIFKEGVGNIFFQLADSTITSTKYVHYMLITVKQADGKWLATVVR
jgi:hypothetical protein